MTPPPKHHAVESSQPSGLATLDVAGTRARLLDWFGEHRRDLPWRRTRDPYAIWISEAMLQQTRVETVIPYFERFLERFPDVDSLAHAPLEDVLAAWSGLGYYRRARALQNAAQVVCETHGGEFPREEEAVRALPGVGPYTAGAVLSIAFDQSVPLVDGNVARVFARLFALEDPLGSRELERELWALARALVPVGRERGAKRGPNAERGPGAWNQALMELGATVCTPRDPGCADCPLANDCRAHQFGRVDALPHPKPKPTPIDVELEALWVEADGQVLLVRRGEEGRMAGLLELPTRERVPAGEEPRLFATSFPRSDAGQALRAGGELGQLRHGITRHRIRLVVRSGRPVGSSKRSSVGEPGRAAWFSVDGLADLALTGMARKVLRSAFLPQR